LNVRRRGYVIRAPTPWIYGVGKRQKFSLDFLRDLTGIPLQAVLNSGLLALAAAPRDLVNCKIHSLAAALARRGLRFHAQREHAQRVG